MVAMYKQGVIVMIQDKAKNGSHDLNRNVLFLRALHVEDVVPHAVVADEGLITFGEVLIDKSPGALLDAKSGKMQHQ